MKMNNCYILHGTVYRMWPDITCEAKFLIYLSLTKNVKSQDQLITVECKERISTITLLTKVFVSM